MANLLKVDPWASSRQPIKQELSEFTFRNRTVAEVVKEIAAAPTGTFAIIPSRKKHAATLVLKDRIHLLKMTDRIQITVNIPVNKIGTTLTGGSGKIEMKNRAFDSFRKLREFYELGPSFRQWSQGLHVSPQNKNQRLKEKIESPLSGWVHFVHIHNMGPISKYLMENPQSFSISSDEDQYHLTYSKDKDLVFETFYISDGKIKVVGQDQTYKTLSEFLFAFGKDLQNALPEHLCK